MVRGAEGAGDRSGQPPLVVGSVDWVGEAYGPPGHGIDPVPSSRLRNTTSRPLVIERVIARWDTRAHRRTGRTAGAFLVGSDADLSWGEGGTWPPAQFSDRQRRTIPDARLAAHEPGQVWIGVRRPQHGTLHLVGLQITYRFGRRRHRVIAPVDFWYCPGQTSRRCDAQVRASRSGG